MVRLIARIRYSVLQLLISIDQLLATVIKIPVYVVFSFAAPDADETISSIVGRNALVGKRWALIGERVINPIFRLLGQHDHCRSSVELLHR